MLVSIASIMDKIGKAENDISAANDVTRRRQQHQPQEMNEFYERVKANPKLLLEMFPHEIRSAQQEKSQSRTRKANLKTTGAPLPAIGNP